MKQKYRYVIIGLIVFVFILLLIIGMIYMRRHYDFGKANIFQISGTKLYYEVNERKEVDIYYMVQTIPSTRKEVLQMVNLFLEEEGILENEQGKVHYIDIFFMTPGGRLSIEFEENKSPFIMDDFIENYISSNCFLQIRYNVYSDEIEYRYYNCKYIQIDDWDEDLYRINN